MDNKLYKVLLNLGLSDNEALVYLSALSLGKTTILAISKASEVKRTTVYSAVESLKQLGLMKVEQIGWKTLFSAENPEKLERIMDNKKKELQESLVDFKALYSAEGGSSLIKYYEGVEAVKNIHLDLLDEVKFGEDYWVISDSAKWMSEDQRFFENFVEKRAQKKLNNRLLLQDSEIARKYKQNEAIYNLQIKIFPQDMQLSASITITPSKILIHQTTLPVIAMVIENKNIIRLHKELFEFMWKAITADQEPTHLN
ncbi:MAG: helix-turn-helix domain-containing protein [Candidatus Moraniibacteriota bacterium]